MAKSKHRKRNSQPVQSQQESTIKVRPLLIDRLADAALILGLFTVLAFVEIRFEGFETEKAALLPIYGGIILAAHLTRLFRGVNIPWKQLLLNPMVIGIFGIIITSSISTALSLSPARSWIGEAERLSGLQTLFIYLLLFSQAIVSHERITRLLTPIIITISAPLCLSIFFARFHQGIARPGSTTGNANYLSSWLVMSMLILLFQLYIRVRGKGSILPAIRRLLYSLGRNFFDVPPTKNQEAVMSLRHVADIALTLAMVVFMVLTIVIVGSRAALLSFAIGGIIAIGIILAIAKQRRALIMFSALVILSGLGYVTASNLVPPELKTTGGMFRVLNLGDARRQELWNGAISVISQQTIPYYSPDGIPDALASVRPAFGYGLSVISQTQGRFGKTSHENAFVGSFHNHIFDHIVMTGYPGMMAYVLTYLGAMYLALKVFGLIHGDTFRWIMVILMFGLIGILVTPSLFPRAEIVDVLPIGISLGVLAGNFVWIAGQAFRKSENPEGIQGISDSHIMIATLLGIIVLRWVDIQFAFVQAASEPLFWVLAGLFLGHVYKLRMNPIEDTHSLPYPRPIDWQMAMLATGVILFYGFGVTIASNVYHHAIGLDTLLGFSRLGWMVAILLVVSTFGAIIFVDTDNPYHTLMIAFTVLAWMLMFIMKLILSSSAGSLFDNTVALDLISKEGMFSAFFQLSFVGIVMVIILLVAWTVYDNWRLEIKNPFAIGIVILFAVIGMTYYSMDYTASSLHAVGNGFMKEGASNRDEKAFKIADTAYTLALELDPTNARLRIHYIGLMAQENGIFSNRPNFDTEIADNVQTLLFYEPYFIHTLEWNQFAGYYERIFGHPLYDIVLPQ